MGDTRVDQGRSALSQDVQRVPQVENGDQGTDYGDYESQEYSSSRNSDDSGESFTSKLLFAITSVIKEESNGLGSIGPPSFSIEGEVKKESEPSKIEDQEKKSVEDANSKAQKPNNEPIAPLLPPRRKFMRSQTVPNMGGNVPLPVPPPKPKGLGKRMTTCLPADFDFRSHEQGNKPKTGLGYVQPRTAVPTKQPGPKSEPDKKEAPEGKAVTVEDEHTKEIRKMLEEPRLKEPRYQMEKFSTKRDYVALEIFTSEHTYVKSLNVLVKGYLLPLRNVAEGVKSGSFVHINEVQGMFKYVENILEFNLMLYASLEKRILEWSPTQKLADVILDVIPVFKLYSSFVSNYDNAMIILNHCEKNQEFSNFVHFRKSRAEFLKYHLQDFLILPVQRIPRYKLLLQELLKYTPDDHPDFEDLGMAFSKIKEVAMFVNKSLQEHKEKFKVLEIENRIYGKKGSIAAPHRRFIKEGSLIKVCRKRPKSRIFFLFNDIVIYGDLVPSGKISLHNSIKLINCTVEDVADTEEMKNAFKILSTVKSITVFTNDPQVKVKWLEAFGTAIEAEKNKKRVDGDVAADTAAPIWMRDSETNVCQLCRTSFTWKKRRHHCRNCGIICCARCSSHRIILPQISKNEEVRVCDNCYSKLHLKKRS